MQLKDTPQITEYRPTSEFVSNNHTYMLFAGFVVRLFFAFLKDFQSLFIKHISISISHWKEN